MIVLASRDGYNTQQANRVRLRNPAECVIDGREANLISRHIVEGPWELTFRTFLRHMRPILKDHVLALPLNYRGCSLSLQVQEADADLAKVRQGFSLFFLSLFFLFVNVRQANEAHSTSLHASDRSQRIIIPITSTQTKSFTETITTRLPPRSHKLKVVTEQKAFISNQLPQLKRAWLITTYSVVFTLKRRYN